MLAAILITSFKRFGLLKYGLESLAKQSFDRSQVQVVVLNDGIQDDTEAVCRSFENKLNIKYIFTGANSTGWRVPGFAINYGVKNTKSDYIFISCAEMYHYDDTVTTMLQALKTNKKLLTIPHAKDDDGQFLLKLDSGGAVDDQDYIRLGKLHNIHLPFFMGMNREDFVMLRGYDEDFTGVGYDDNDIVERMLALGNKHHKVDCRLVHLYHDRIALDEKMMPKYKYNERLFLSRRGQLVRNQNKNWGLL